MATNQRRNATTKAQKSAKLAKSPKPAEKSPPAVSQTTIEPIPPLTEVKSKKWLKPADVEAEFGISIRQQAIMRSRNYRKGKGERIPFSKFGGKFVFYNRERLDQWLLNNEFKGDGNE